ncbi:MAG: hypothetical protein CSA23_02810 [Deltaproteobacteria bacterium]|nr:MAG: hypothetical protein CSA23_02810 [Deltaproteobacteria bacterium]
MNTFKKWEKLGLLYCPPVNGRHPKLITHAANPLPIHLEKDVFRIFFSGRDEKNRSSVSAVDIDIVSREVIKDHNQPFFQHGDNDCFYADGVSIGNCYEVDGITYMLFMGWYIPKRGHWRGSIGRLVVKSDFSLVIDGYLPFIDINDKDPISLSYPWVVDHLNGTYDMWYGSTKTWDAGNGEMLHVINFASSMDGHHWKRKGTAIPYEIGKAQAFSRPTVIKHANGKYEMWFSYRDGSGQTYRIGHAFSINGVKWELALESVGIDISRSGWDSEMIEYPFVFKHKGILYMLYNGNGYGKSGIGLAKRE